MLAEFKDGVFVVKYSDNGCEKTIHCKTVFNTTDYSYDIKCSEEFLLDMVDLINKVKIN